MAPVALPLAALFAVGFLLGSIPWGLIISKVFYKKDIREQGSGNIGATNAVRGMGFKGGVPVLLLDVGKGVAAGALAQLAWAPLMADALGADSVALCTAVAFLGCVMGHIFCPWLGFRGGKGISVAFGCEFFALGPAAALIELAVFAAFALTSRRVSLGSVMAAVACPFLAVWARWGCWPAVIMASIAAILVIWAHRGNISRLLHGEEPRFSGSKAAEPASEEEA